MPTPQELAVAEYQASVEAERLADQAVKDAMTAVDDAKSALSAAQERKKVAEKALLKACEPVKP